jgi:hypothetical protein
VEYGRILVDPLFDHNNTWAFRTTAAAAASFAGGMPIYARFFTTDELVRGLHPGELGPYATEATISSSGTTKYSAAPAGANLIAASNLEYRHPLPHGTEAAGFVDTGSGLLLPNWLGSTRPLLIDSTNGLIHMSTGLELRWTLPVLEVPLRINYSFNILRLDRSCQTAPIRGCGIALGCSVGLLDHCFERQASSACVCDRPRSLSLPNPGRAKVDVQPLSELHRLHLAR